MIYKMNTKHSPKKITEELSIEGDILLYSVISFVFFIAAIISFKKQSKLADTSTITYYYT